MTDPNAALERAGEHCFMSGVGDVGESLCEANMRFGLAKIHHVQRELGFPADATFVGATDATVTRNTNRWKQGFGYGGRVRWSGDFAVLDIKSNACGMIVVDLDDPPPTDQIERRAEQLKREPLTIDGVNVDFDLGEGNHFLDLCDVRETYGDADAAGKTYAIIHSSGHEHRTATERGPGIYYDASEELRKRAEVFQTPWGPLHVLTGAAGAEWYAHYRWVQDFSLRRREAMARALLGPLSVVCNRTHQGLLSMNDAILGCYAFDDNDLASGQLFPLTLAPDLPAYLVRPRPNFDSDALESTGFGERARRLGVLERVAESNILPHGGGYSYAQYDRVGDVRTRDGLRYFELHKPDGSVDAVADVRAAAYGYRGDEVRRRMLDLRLAELRVKTEITYVLKR